MTIYPALLYSFPKFEPVSCRMSGSNYYFLNHIQVSQETSEVVWYSHLLKNFPQFVVIHRVKGFGVINKAEVDAFLELSCFLNQRSNCQHLLDHRKSKIGPEKQCQRMFKILSVILLACEMSAIVN